MPAVLQGPDPWFLDKALGPLELRAVLAAVMGHNSLGGTGSEGGVILGAGANLAVAATSPSASMQLTVSTGAAVIPRAGQHAYVGPFGPAGNIDIDAANATNPRIDTVIVRVRDPELLDPSNGVSNKGLFVEVVKGAAAAVPAAPSLAAIPACLPLCDVFVPSAPNMPSTPAIVNANLTDRRWWTRAAGGIRYAAGAEARGGAYPWDMRVGAAGLLDMWDPTASLWVTLLNPRAWTSYTPTITATGGALNLGSGTGVGIFGRYVQIGKTLIVRIWMVVGSGNDTRSGPANFGLPPGFTIANNNGAEQVGKAKLYHPTGGTFYGGIYAQPGATTIQAVLPVDSTHSNCLPMRSAELPGVTGGGIPSIPGQYTLRQDSNVNLLAILEMA
ncbi:hypothetical protein [Saccharothrix lopnurensis]|uniref:Minor tail protein n=1 Tax=Saccharothrix lopnurensis TaxID=1670621 RepID=A0ABW1P5J8_9PSEU